MKHLTDEQLSGLLDGALAAGERAACEAHLAGCDACRARLAEASALDASLGRALTHDPGDEYFADFAERVGKRIAADSQPVTPKARKSPISWLLSPRGLTLAGSTAALLVTAGLAWMRFRADEDNGHRALTDAIGARRSAVSLMQSGGAADSMRPFAAPPPASTAPAPAASRLDEPTAPSSRGVMRARRVPANGSTAELQARDKAGEADGQALKHDVQTGAAPQPPQSAIAQMKRRAVAPADKDAGAPSAQLEKEQPAPSEEAQRAAKNESLSASVNAVAPAPAPVPAAAKTKQLAPQSGADQKLAQAPPAAAREQSTSSAQLGSSARDEVAATAPSACGTVRDSRGQPLGGASVFAVHAGVRTARSGPDGRFCVDGLKPGDTLTVMRVGFDPYTVVIGSATSLAIALEPVGTLGPQSGMMLGKQGASPPSMSFFGNPPSAPATAFSESVARVRAADVYADEPDDIRRAVKEAREAGAIAAREQTVQSYEDVADRWAAISVLVTGAPSYDARFRTLAAIREAYHAEPSPERVSRLRSALASFMATTPPSLPERATVQRWQAELRSSGYR